MRCIRAEDDVFISLKVPISIISSLSWALLANSNIQEQLYYTSDTSRIEYSYDLYDCDGLAFSDGPLEDVP